MKIGNIILPAFFAFGATLSAGSELDSARGIFHKAISKAYGIPLGKINVQPAYPGLPDNPYDALKTGTLFAFRASWKNADPGPGGYAAADGRAAFMKHPDGMKQLLLACNAGDAEKSLPLPELVKRISWAYAGLGQPIEAFDHGHSAIRKNGEVTIVFHTRLAAETGTFRYSRVTLEMDSKGNTKSTVTRLNNISP